MRSSQVPHNSAHVQMSLYFVLNSLIHFGSQALIPSSHATSSRPQIMLSATENFESPLHFYPLSHKSIPPTPSPTVTDRTTKEFYSFWLINLKFSEVKLKFPWERNSLNIHESHKFLYRNKTI